VAVVDNFTDVAGVAFAAPVFTHVATPELGVFRRGVTLRAVRGEVCPQLGWAESRQRRQAIQPGQGMTQTPTGQQTPTTQPPSSAQGIALSGDTAPSGISVPSGNSAVSGASVTSGSASAMANVRLVKPVFGSYAISGSG
jgi:hypothetical protein